MKHDKIWHSYISNIHLWSYSALTTTSRNVGTDACGMRPILYVCRTLRILKQCYIQTFKDTYIILLGFSASDIR